MAKNKSKSYDVDFDDYEEKEGGYSGEEPKRGAYEGKLVSCDDHTSGAGNEGLEWVFEITEEPYAGWRGWVYSNLDSAKWKTQQIVKALNGGEEKKTKIETGGSDSPMVKKSSPVILNIRQEEYEDEKRGRIRQVLPNEKAASKKKDKKKKKGDDPF